MAHKRQEVVARWRGSGWLRNNARARLCMIGIHAAQRWLNGAWI
ncbi:MAG: hypothetical protein Q9P01_00220 [Anaerolineae bacterium]|nr:hypothetical protein [Anaerolineae bacterium]